jgi:hypothetical protein
MRCNTPKCLRARLILKPSAHATCSQKRTEQDMRRCGDIAVAVCPCCGEGHCAKHVPSVNYYDHSIKSP